MYTTMSLIIITVVILTVTHREVEGSCLTFSRLSCTEGDKRGLGTDFNRSETRLISGMEFNCTGTLVGWTVSGRRGSGTMYPKLQIWRRNGVNEYYRNGPEIQIDAQGSACETITQNANCSQEFHCRLSAANNVSVLSGSDIIGVELPPIDNQGFELLFISHNQIQHVWRREITISSLTIGTEDLIVRDDLLLNVEVLLDPDECLANTDDCDQLCTNTIGSFQCSCIDGYTLSSNGRSCLDIDECTVGTHNCQQHCINIVGRFLCDCNSGYQLNSDRRTCSDIDECLADTDDCDQFCKNTIGSFQCSCIDGYTLSSNGRSCLDINECANGTHNCQQLCVNINGGFICDCNSGYQLNSDGRNCSNTGSSFPIVEAAVGGTIGTALFLLLVIILPVISIMIRRYNRKKQSTVESSGYSKEITQHVLVLKGTIKTKFPPSLEISSTNLQVSDPIGQGEFGIVYKGYFTGQFTTEIVAIKTLKGFIDEDAVQELLSECVKMKSFNHPHVMSLKGVCLDGGPVPYIILPYMANGSLLSYLQKKQSDLVVAPGTDVPQSQIEIIEKQLLDMCFQVAEGMEYLAHQKVVHRDLAARNCMIDMNMIIKVSDFGLSVSTGEKEYYRLSGDMGIKLPFRWMAPETFSDYIFSEKSDVWSYGITCWEIFTGGQVPYAGIRPTSLQTILQGGERLETPNNSACSDEMYSVMQWCWEMDPDKRPSFSTLVESISRTLEDMADYVDMGAFSDHYDASFGQAEAT